MVDVAAVAFPPKVVAIAGDIAFDPGGQLARVGSARSLLIHQLL